MDLDSIITQLIEIAEEQNSIVRGKTTFEEQSQRRNRIFALKSELKKSAKEFEGFEGDHLRFIETYLKLENFMVGIPLGTSVVSPGQIKQTVLENGTAQHEQRFYFCTHFRPRDNDGLSVVFAKTPPSYKQPFHAHYQSNEFTLSLSHNVRVGYRHGLVDDTLQIPRGSIGASDKGVPHTIYNLSKIHYAPNVSVKIPDSLEDRFAIHDTMYCPDKRKPRILAPEIESLPHFETMRHSVEDGGYEYTVQIRTFKGDKSMKVKARQESHVYFVVDGTFSVLADCGEYSAPTNSLVVIDPGNCAKITPLLNGGTNSLYWVSKIVEPRS